jgi:hypothetical protein
MRTALDRRRCSSNICIGGSTPLKFRVGFQLPLEGIRERDPKALCDETTLKISAIDGVASCSGSVSVNAIKGTAHIDASDRHEARNRIRAELNRVVAAEGLGGHRWSLVVDQLDSDQPSELANPPDSE